MNIYLLEKSSPGNRTAKLIDKDFLCVCKTNRKPESNPKLLFKDRIKK